MVRRRVPVPWREAFCLRSLMASLLHSLCSLRRQILEGSEGGVAGWGGWHALHFARWVSGRADAAEAAIQQVWGVTERWADSIFIHFMLSLFNQKAESSYMTSTVWWQHVYHSLTLHKAYWSITEEWSCICWFWPIVQTFLSSGDFLPRTEIRQIRDIRGQHVGGTLK